MNDITYSRLLILVAGLLGAAGVALAAGAAHSGASVRLLLPAAGMCLVHAPALIALDAHTAKPRMFTLGSALIGGGTLLFSGDLAVRAFEGPSLFAMAAPIGGTAMIIGWVAVALGAFARLRQ